MARVFEFEFSATVIRWQADAAWHFVPLPVDLGEEINRWAGDLKGGWGSIKVDVRIGETRWKTSIFPDSSTGSFLLPVKAAVRKAEGIAEGDTVDVVLTM